MKLRRPFRALLACAILAAIAVMFVVVIWIPLYRDSAPAGPAGAQEPQAVEVDLVDKDGGSTRSWTVADQKAISKLRAGLQSAQPAAPPAEPAAAPSEEKYRLRIKGANARVDEYEVVLGTEGRAQDRVYVIRRNGGTSVYGTAVNTPELKSALQQVLTPTAPR
jgi:hypothetical protein